jgi:predicted nucleic acid-binding protein
MNGIDYFLADTNFLINISEDNHIVYPFLDNNICVSYITEIELLGVFSINKEQKHNAQNLINECFILDMNSKIKQKVIKLKQQYKLKIPDAIIAATALVYQLPLITSDANFKKILELELIFLEK